MQRRTSLGWPLMACLLLTGTLAACGKSSRHGLVEATTTGGTSGTGGTPDTGGSAAQGGDSGCKEGVTSKRVVRLTFRQVVRSLGSLINPALADDIAVRQELNDGERPFLALLSPREGTTYGYQHLEVLDAIALTAGAHVSANFAAVTGCEPEGKAACARAFLLDFAERAFRRPLQSDEQERLKSRFAGFLAMSDEVTVEQALEYGVAAVIHSPQFAYRSELGEQADAAGELTPHELASELSYFLTDAPPDVELLEAARSGGLSQRDELEAQTRRLLELDATRANLQSAMAAYFGYNYLPSVIVDDAAFTRELRQSMHREGELFLRQALWEGPVNDVLLSRSGFVDARLAPVYGLPQFPPEGAALDADGFARIVLPPQRSGIITQAGFLTGRSRPDGPSVVGRGLLVRDAFVCTQSPPPPDDILPDEIQQGLNPRQAAEARAKSDSCNFCHDGFDAYGLALETFDSIGRYRATYADGTRIDPVVTLPEDVGGRPVADAVEMAAELAKSGSWARCLTRNLFDYAIADVSAGSTALDSCTVDNAVADFEGAQPSFADVLVAVAKSDGFTTRAKPPAP